MPFPSPTTVKLKLIIVFLFRWWLCFFCFVFSVRFSLRFVGIDIDIHTDWFRVRRGGWVVVASGIWSGAIVYHRRLQHYIIKMWQWGEMWFVKVKVNLIKPFLVVAWASSVTFQIEDWPTAVAMGHRCFRRRDLRKEISRLEAFPFRKSNPKSSVYNNSR